MVFIAVVRLNKWATIEKQFETEKRAQIWAFEQEGTLVTISVMEDEFADTMMKKVIAVYGAETRDNRN